MDLVGQLVQVGFSLAGDVEGQSLPRSRSKSLYGSLIVLGYARLCLGLFAFNVLRPQLPTFYCRQCELLDENVPVVEVGIDTLIGHTYMLTATYSADSGRSWHRRHPEGFLLTGTSACSDELQFRPV